MTLLLGSKDLCYVCSTLYDASLDPYNKKSKDSYNFMDQPRITAFPRANLLRACRRLGRQQFGKVANPSIVNELAPPHVTTLSRLCSRRGERIRFFLFSTCERWYGKCSVEGQSSVTAVASGNIIKSSKFDEYMPLSHCACAC